ncbi:SET domain-containing protein [Teratosphaeria destructans]|uniref:SET domain-containing protein n=1 Tax=Teratosphaeria destructans TaxID=418781 RepID=A0A9W7W3T1_9PEZI|nr:SET domain-containing protein [Teratosphaeria destructans]
MSGEDLESVAQEIADRIGEQLPSVILELLQSGYHVGSAPLQIECSLATFNAQDVAATRVKVASVEVNDSRLPTASPQTPIEGSEPQTPNGSEISDPSRIPQDRFLRPRIVPHSHPSEDEAPMDSSRPSKRRRATGGLTVGARHAQEDPTGAPSRRFESDSRVFPQRKKRLSENPLLQPSTLDKFINGIWESIYSGVRMDPAEVIEQWQAIESSGQPRLLMEAEHELALRDPSMVQNIFGRMNMLTRKISQTSRTCRSLEVIVQAYWVQCFDDRVVELAESMTREKAKKAAIAEACVDLAWNEKELRNKMGIWRGYHDIQSTAGWAALVFAGMGLYRFCKYRTFTEDTFQKLKALRHRFEVAADTLHPGWRNLLSIIGAPTQRLYTGHPHDWVVNGPGHTPIALPETYRQWDPHFSYTHLENSTIDEDVWGQYDPRMIAAGTSGEAHKCQACGEIQSEDVKLNECRCFPDLYGGVKAGSAPVQVFRTPNGKNNGLIACLPFERGTAIGEFVGQVTSGLANLDVMVGTTDRATYQIWQGKAGNHIRFVNHSCQPNSQFERFVWLGTQRIVLVSKGIEAGDEITVDYSDTYWKVRPKCSDVGC